MSQKVINAKKIKNKKKEESFKKLSEINAEYTTFGTYIRNFCIFETATAYINYNHKKKETLISPKNWHNYTLILKHQPYCLVFRLNFAHQPFAMGDINFVDILNSIHFMDNDKFEYIAEIIDHLFKIWSEIKEIIYNAKSKKVSKSVQII